MLPTSLDRLDSSKKGRYVKLHADEFISEYKTGKQYDYTVYIDGNLRITCDIKPLVYSLIESGKTIAIHKHYMRNCIYDEAIMCFLINKAAYKNLKKQMNFYSSDGMPEHFGLWESGVIIRKCKVPELSDLMHQWWEQIESFTQRDQLSLPYVLWKNNKTSSYIHTLGNNIWKNPYFIYHPHNK